MTSDQVKSINRIMRGMLFVFFVILMNLPSSYLSMPCLIQLTAGNENFLLFFTGGRCAACSYWLLKGEVY